MVIRLMKSMLYDQRKTLFFVFIGMALCNFVVLNFTGSVLGSGYTEEELDYYNNRITFVFSDIEKVNEITDKLQGMDHVENVFLTSTDKISSKLLEVTACAKMPSVKEETMVTGHMPETLQEGEAVVDIVGLVEMGKTQQVIAVGDVVSLGSRKFTCKAETNAGKFKMLLCREDFISLYEKYGEGELKISYLYNDKMSAKEKEQIRNEVEAIQKPDAVETTEKMEKIQYADFIESIQDLILGMIIAILNNMFLYAYVLNSRIPTYSVLKIQGISNGILMFLLFSEMLILYILSFLLSLAGYYIYMLAVRNVFYNVLQISSYTFVSLFVMNTVVFFFVTQKLVRMQPFEIYRRKLR